MTKKLAPIHPGEVLLEEFLKPMGLSQNQLALSIGVSPRRINEMLRLADSFRVLADQADAQRRALGEELDLELLAQIKIVRHHDPNAVFADVARPGAAGAGLTVMVTVFEVAGLPPAQVALEVKTQVIASQVTGT